MCAIISNLDSPYRFYWFGAQYKVRESKRALIKLSFAARDRDTKA